jgi:hypothetical protein
MSEEALSGSSAGMTVEEVWALLRETDRIVKETALRQAETDRIVKETALRQAETDRQMQETDRKMQETDRKMQETDRKISKLGSRLGDLVEEIVFPNIMEKFNALGYNFGNVATDVRYKEQGQVIAEVDIRLEDGDQVLMVEVKTTLTRNDVLDHLQRMEKLRLYADAHKDRRKLLGAVAGAIAPEKVKSFAIESGLFVLEQSGDTIRISIPRDFKPREW